MNKNFLSISLVIAFSIVLWVFVSLSREYFTKLEAEVQIVQLPENYTVGYISEKNVSLNIKGQGWQLASITFGRSFNFYVSANLKTGNHSVFLRNKIEQNGWIPSNIQVVDIQPTTIEFDVEEEESKRVPIIANVSLDFNPEFGLISNIKVYPDSLTVVGPKSKIEDLQFVETVYSEFNNLQSKTSAILDISELENMEYQLSQCRVEFDVQKIVDITFENIPVEIRNIPTNETLQLFPDKIRVAIRGGIDILSQIKKEDIIVYVNFGQAERDTLGAIIPVVELPKQTTLLDSRPKKLDYIIKRF